MYASGGIIFLFHLVMAGCDTSPVKDPVVLPAHAHNDYQHERPLLDALECKFKSIEADVFSRGDSLFVAHDAHDIKAGRTLRKLYLDPIKQIIEKNDGSVYGEGTTLILFIDIKDDGLRTYRLLHEILKGYTELLTTYVDGTVKTGAITVIISGNRPFEYMQNQDVRLAGYDGRLRDLESGLPSFFMPVISDNWNRHFTWKGEGEMPADEYEKLVGFIKKAHQYGFMVRFWATPDSLPVEREAVWTVLREAQVDLIGTDDLKGLQSWLLNR